LLKAAGLPDGVFNVVHGAKEAVDLLLSHHDVSAVSFVGSASVAADIYTKAAAHGKRVQALGGAKNHILVMDDADLERSAPHVISSAFGNAGQRCLAGSVAVGVGKVGDSLVRQLKNEAEQVRVGPGTDPQTTMGPVIRAERKRRLVEYIDEAQRQGARLVTDGREGAPRDGFFLRPTIFDGVTPEMRIWREELFGPVLSVVRASDIDEALRVLNSSTFGNMASIFTSSGKNAREFKRRAQAGMLGINIGVAAPMAFFPFTGWKNSFFGDLHATGMDGIRFYTRHKVVTSRWL
jgi:malonate-semialdehyde dehydrogenase (acetylating)/methylmalonate-semialdehyde dehydrogenase